MENSNITNVRPYLLRAFYDWLLDNQLTPYLLVNINTPEIEVPLIYTSNGQIILNVEPQAVKDLNLGNDFITFNTRFHGISHYINLPINSILAIYAHENGIGTVFEYDNPSDKKNINFQTDIKNLPFNNKYSNIKDKIDKKIINKKQPKFRVIK
ncbi:ClpXP protease specificity-enhancing factor [Candidatus Pantoea edessiphila]|uniref:ClpXP protease specificity-enhancing factor n=1 Tax=Candidatus Pantoea edessiphila TaxID=2044610 RepID=A0A2P5T206_9GAMM|nr:ClpXP protease specificity-enhancing factor [Candidatus Pantoea edessiphila]PPI88596.1 ClpXP protease specificity-enhancing factor [Candidatus Pantoea edessiphila]